MSSRSLRASRRAVLTGGAGVLAVATVGCGSAQDAARTGPDGLRNPSEPAVDADSDLVERATGDLAAALALATATGRAYPPLRPITGGLAALHRSHGRELGGLPDVERAEAPAGPAAQARATLLAAEERLQRRLVQAALAAESGALAQTFASMAAAVAQRQAVAAS